MKESSSNKEMRKIIINDNQIKHYVDNTIKTAKYNWFTFLPLAIIYQFNNYFNIFFLITAIILAIKEISPMDPGVAIGPFIFVIMVSVIREGIEDFVRLFLIFRKNQAMIRLIIILLQFALTKKTKKRS
jgi:hypothetical protein